MREIICIVKRSRGSKRRPKVMIGIGHTHPTSGTRNTTKLPQKRRRSAQYSYSINTSPI